MNEKAKELGVDGPLVTKYYGDTQREAAMKYKKGVSWAKRWKNLSDEDKRPKFSHQLTRWHLLLLVSFTKYKNSTSIISLYVTRPWSGGKYFSFSFV